MALGDSYATLLELKGRLGMAQSDVRDDARLTDILAAASASVNGFCGRQFNDAGATTKRWFYPDTAYIADIDDFSTATGFILVVNTATWTSDMYQLEPLNGVVNGMTGWPYWRISAVLGNTFVPLWTGKANIEVTARWGWSAVPKPVKEACLVLAEEAYRLKDAPFGVGGYGSFGVIKVRDNPFAARLLQQYQRDQFLAA